ncbi:hypothetical protein KDA11_02040 [Candidatus Saccharibacteria bacterium]|nr:hypothetical protein [Candidatus Saccharibacteria bacterium]
MDKKWFKRLNKFLKRINVWIFFVFAIISAVVCIWSLRKNNLTAIELRDQVVKVDKEDGDVELALKNLRQYTYNHMNTSLSSGDNGIKQPVQLKYRYERLVAAEQQRLSEQNSKIYQDAQAECERLYPVGLSGSGRIPCITDYVSAQGVEQREIPDSLYKFDFVSPVWSSDLAGWSLVSASVFLALFVLRFGIDRWVKAELHDL